MLYQPTNIYPSMTGGLGNGVIDASKDLTVSWQVNGNSALLSFQITIYKNDSTSTQVYTTGQISEGCPFYGTDYAGNAQFFSYTIPASSLASAGIANGYQYKLLIKQWWGNSDSVTQSAASAFITRATPSLQIGVFPAPIAERSYTFTAKYKQEQGDGLNWIRWMIASKQDNEYRTLRDSGNIYGTSVFQFSYDGLFSGNSYAIRCEAQTENGVTVDTGWNDFSVLYTTEKIDGTLKACGSRKGNGVRLSIPGTVNIPATVSGNGEYDISGSVINANDGDTITWDSVDGTDMDIPNFNPMFRFSTPYRGGGVEISGVAPDIGGFIIADVPFEPQIICAFTETISIASGDGIYYHSMSGVEGKNDFASGWVKSSFQMPAGVSWTARCVAFGGSSLTNILLITDGTTGAISSDGITWQTVTLPGTGYQSASYLTSESLYVIGGIGSDGNAKISYSSDARSWTAATYTNASAKKTGAVTSFTSSKFSSVTETHHICVTENGFTLMSDNGTTWSTTSITNQKFRKVIPTTFEILATVSDEGSKSVWVSSDGYSWTEYDIGIHVENVSYVSYKNVSLALLSGISGNNVVRFDYTNGKITSYVSDLGISNVSGFGTEIVSTYNSSFETFFLSCYKDKESGSNLLIIGDENAPIPTNIALEFHADARFLIVSSTIPVSAAWTRLIYGNGLLVGISKTSGSVIYGTDGEAWSVAETGLSGCSDIVACDGFFIILGSDGSIYATESFSAFEKRGTLRYATNAISYGNGMLACVGKSGFTEYSEDYGYTWSVKHIEASSTLNSVCFGAGRFLAVGESGVYAYSFNGIDWSEYTIPAEPFSVVRYVGGKFVAIPSEKKYVYYSDDGIQWNRSAQTDDGNVFYDVTYCFGQFLFSTDLGRGNISGVSTFDFKTFSVGLYQSGIEEEEEIHAICYNNEKVVALQSTGSKSYAQRDSAYLSISEIYDGFSASEGSYNYGDTLSVSKDGVSTILNGSASKYVQNMLSKFSSVTSMKLVGPVSCDYLMLAKEDYTEDQIDNFLEDASYHPRDVAHYFYADFDSGLNAGGFGSTGFSDLAIYRQTPGDSVLTHVADISPDDGASIVDVGAVMGKTYTYYAYGIGQQNSSALISNDISLCFWDWVLLSCTADDNGVYHPQQIFLFSNNVSSGDVSNNNAPNVLQNFTRYPAVQSSPWNYRSGTLTSLIGSVSGGKYCDSVELRNAITELSTTSRVLFLKNRKGDLIKIALSGAIEMETMDNSPQQAQTMNLPWVEIGDASGVSIVLMQSDGAWVQSLDSPVVMGCCGTVSGAATSYAYPLTILQQGKSTVYDGSEPKKVVIKDGGGSGEIVAEDDGSGNITIY